MVLRRKFQDMDWENAHIGNAHIGTWIEVGCKYRDLDGSQVGPE